MSIPKQHNKRLPPRLRYKHGAYYYVVYRGGEKWTRLGTDYNDAIRQWKEREDGRAIESHTVSAALDKYILARKDELATTTLKEYIRQSHRLRQAFKSFAVGDIEPFHIAQYLDAHPHKTAANREIALLSATLNHVRALGWCRGNPAQGIRCNKLTKRTRYITDGELDALCAAATDQQFAALIRIAYLTGLRKGDLLRLRWRDIRNGELEIVTEKTGLRIHIEVTPGIQAQLDMLKGRKVASLHLFARRDGQPYTIDGFSSIWQRLVKRSLVPDCHFHDLRAKCLTDAQRIGGSDYAHNLAGHASVTTTEGYIKGRVNKVRPLG